ncbi:helicase SNF2 family protein [Ktedonobacter robiniae]|uniref:Helicase SNF2 family protein n=1 Tax=Ktedonobacter robiniae TaxID=2778365 RepID=A0ABQ3UTD1_9CHLR|nr:DISARM system SNF2-like helicase DrmD [Ktedonobacter robiniae]GHO56053.1 helicase SNF2 family protein [Ktedonobacter robiniae]
MVRSISLPEPGQLVHVRQRRYVVVDIPTSVHNSQTLHSQHLITLSSVEDDGLGEDLQVIWEIEPGASLIEKTPLPQPVGFDTPQRLDTFLNAVRWGAASSADVKAIQAPFLSGIDLEDYQLDPVARAIQMPRANLLIADDVGLGKTIEAGLVAQELIIRQRARRILIVCPAALQVQWRDQMRDKFGLEFRIVDSELMKSLRRERGLHVNPWKHFPRLITSIDFLKRDRPQRLFREALPSSGESIYPRRFDLLILDEAHNVAPSGQGKYAISSMRTEAIRLLAPHFEHKLFLSATPHNGYSESFTALLELLDNQRFARGVKPDHEQLNAVMIRRLKTELPRRWNGSSRFPVREITPLRVPYTQQEREAHQLLQEYGQSRIKASGDNVGRYATEFVLKLLKKRLFSSPEAFYLTLEQHQRTLGEKQRHTSVTKRPGEGILRARVERLEEESDSDESLDEATAEALDTAAPLFHEPTAQEQSLLKRLLTWADDTRRRPDSKAQELIDWLHRTIKPGGKWSNERVIIFTEYRATQNWLYGLLVREGFVEQGPDGEARLQTLYGGMDTKTREMIKAAFQADPADSSVRILLATDAASEGIDLQNHCSHLIHYEIPWNPNRLEQRNGRIDRHGQRAAVVNIYHFVSSLYDQRSMSTLKREQLDDDLEFLMQAVRKIETIREDLGNVGPVIATQVEEAMLGRRRTLDTSEAEKKSPSKRLLAFQRKQREKIEAHIRQLYEQLQEGKRELGLTPENIQAVVETALELAHLPALQKRILEDSHGKYPPIEVFDVPDLPGSWARCTEGLYHPHNTQQRRPIVFDHTLAQGRDDVVLAHLNHRLVTMSLRLLRAEVWASGEQSKLHRVTARMVPSVTMDVPAVIAYARLLVLGGDKQRLHEELITAGGYLREGRFVHMRETQLKEALAAAQNYPVSENMQHQLAAQWDHHREPLVKALEERMNERMKSLQKKLSDRENKEQRDITSILMELKKNIAEELGHLAELEQPGMRQLSLTGFSAEEHQQLRRDISALEAREKQIDDEIRQETERIQQRFADPQPRVFPVAITYLVPAHLAR